MLSYGSRKKKIALDLKSSEYIGWKVQGCRRPKSWFSKWIVAPRGFAVSVSPAPAVFNFSTKCRNQGHRDIFAIQSWNEIESSLPYEASVIFVKLFCSYFWLALCLSFVLNHNYSGELLLFLLVHFVFVSASVNLGLMFHQNSSIWFIFNGFACLTFRAVAGIGICRRDIYRKLLHYYSWLPATGRISIW